MDMADAAADKLEEMDVKGSDEDPVEGVALKEKPVVDVAMGGFEGIGERG